MIRNCGSYAGSVSFGGGVAVYAGGKFIMDGGPISDCYATTGAYGGRAVITGAGGIYSSDKTTIQMSGNNILCNYEASVEGADVYNEGGTINLTSASAMNREFHSTGLTIDGWYSDNADDR